MMPYYFPLNHILLMLFMRNGIHRLTNPILLRHVALPTDHGAWVFLLSPLLIGLFAGGSWSVATTYLVVAAIAVFLMRQPLSIAVKVYSRRRSPRDLLAAWFWTLLYTVIALLGLAGLLFHGYLYLLVLAIPGALVFCWHLYLVSKRAERRQQGVEILGSGVLALSAPAAFWVASSWPDPMGWWLFALVWLQSAASIVHAYMRLEQRVLSRKPDLPTRLKIGQRALLYTTFNLVAVAILATTNQIPAWLPTAYLIQWIETLWCTFNPAINMKPTAIGLRQLLVSSLFTLAFILAWTT
jgi:hypothetical protein